LVLYAGTHGYLDDVDVPAVLTYEKQLLAYARAEGADVLKDLNAASEFSPELEQKIKELLEKFRTVFNAGK